VQQNALGIFPRALSAWVISAILQFFMTGTTGSRGTDHLVLKT